MERIFRRRRAVTALATGCLLGAGAARAQAVVESSFVSMVPSAFPVGFNLLTRGERQYAAYYDSAHDMTVAMRAVGGKTWQKTRLPSQIGWDSHNFVTMALDRQGYLHVTGNMHAVPLVYFRTTQPFDIATLAKVPNLVSAARESKVTYPEFIAGPDGALTYFYRQGSSGDGLWYADRYDEATRAWSALFGGTALFANLDAAGQSVNAYFNGPLAGPDGRFHIFHMWRDTPDVLTCHDACYIRSVGSSLDAWETVDGKRLTLPVSLKDAGATFDPVPVKSGLINMGFAIGFDSHNRAVLSYHKYDAAGISQLYNARFDEARGNWQVVQASAWTGYKWDFGGGGSIASEIGSGPVTFAKDKLTQGWYHAKFGSGTWTLDEATLKPIAGVAAQPKAAAALSNRTAWDKGSGNDPYIRYALHWQTQDANRDIKPDVIPPDSRLILEAHRYSEPIAIRSGAAPVVRESGRFWNGDAARVGFPWGKGRYDGGGRALAPSLP